MALRDRLRAESAHRIMDDIEPLIGRVEPGLIVEAFLYLSWVTMQVETGVSEDEAKSAVARMLEGLVPLGQAVKLEGPSH